MVISDSASQAHMSDAGHGHIAASRREIPDESREAVTRE